jgi:hypothetical protein
MEGTVVSVSRETLVVKTDENDFQLFVFDRYTTKPKAVVAGSRVRVVSSAGEEEGTRLANTITVLSAASDTKTDPTARQATPPPKAVRDLEQNIKSDARRWRLEVRAGAALDQSYSCLACIPRSDPSSIETSSFVPMRSLPSVRLPILLL